MKNEINGTTETIQSPRRSVRLNAETMRALEANDGDRALFSTYSSFCTQICTQAQTCASCHSCTPACPQ